MADFKTHITASSALGAIIGTTAYYTFDMPADHCLIAGGLCGAAGMLPDLDSSSGIPQREMLSLVSVVVPMLMLDRFREFGMEPEQMVLAAVGLYALIRFGVGGLFKRYAKHRGMWHSIPAAVIAGMITYLVAMSGDASIRVFKGWAVMMGFLSHLMLDEIYSVDWQGKKIRVKRSFGTALKFIGSKPINNILIYTKLIVLGIMIFSDDMFMDFMCNTIDENPSVAGDWLHDLLHGDSHDHSHDNTVANQRVPGALR